LPGTLQVLDISKCNDGMGFSESENVSTILDNLENLKYLSVWQCGAQDDIRANRFLDPSLFCAREGGVSDLVQGMRLCFNNPTLLSRMVTANVSALKMDKNGGILLEDIDLEIDKKLKQHVDKYSFVSDGGLNNLLDIFMKYPHHGKLITDTCATIATLMQDEPKLVKK